MTPATLNLIIYQGATFRRVITLTDDDSNPIVLFGAEARMQIRPSVDSDTVLLELTADDGSAVISDPVNGEITLLVDADTTAALTFTSAVYDLEVQYIDTTVDRLLMGKVKLSKEVTR